MADLDGNVTSCNELIPLNCLPATGRLLGGEYGQRSRYLSHAKRDVVFSVFNVYDVEKREAFSVLYSIRIRYAYENDKHTTVVFTNEAASLIADRKVGENSWGLGGW